MTKSDPLHAIEALARGAWGDPFAALGPHLERRGGRMHLVIRTCQPAAARVHVLRLDGLASDEGVAMERRHPAGIFEAAFEDVSGPFPYRLRLTWPDGSTSVADDPYRFGQILGSLDMHLLGEGRHYRSWEKLGAHVVTVDGVAGTYFAVWAPSAQRVSVVGDFNGWDGRVHPMRLLVPNGIWELFIPGVAKGAKYKFEIRTHGGAVFLKADPYARYFEVPPATAAVVWDSAGYAWSDAGWMAARRTWDAWLHRPMATYEVHLGSWARGEGGRHLTYRELAGRLVPYVKDLGFTHLELMPVLEHPFDGSWGYQVTGFFAPTSRFGPPEDFKLFVDECHRQGLGVVLDWVPGHFPKDAHALARFDGTALYEHADPRQGEHTDWGTLIFNYGRNEVRNFLLSSALFWLDEFHLDGLRVDAVASMLYLDYSRTEGQWIPNKYGGRENLEAVDFLRQLNELTHAEHPGTITVAEESTAWPAVSRPVYLGGLGFTYKWNMGWMHDMLLYCTKDPVFRRWEHNKVTFSLLYAWNENFILPFSHDEVVHMKGSMLNKMPGDTWQKAANLRTLYAYMFSHPGKKLLFMGDELGQWTEWSEKASLPWDVLEHPPHQGLLRFVRDLAGLYQRQPSLYDVDFEPSGFEWIDCNDNENSVFAFFRRARDPHDIMVVVLNFTPVARHGYRLGVPFAGHYAELLNSDAQIYGGSNIGNAGGADSDGVPHHGRPQSLQLTLPPLGAIYLKWQWPPDVGTGPAPA